jgi:cupin fold WbuC family metalloprotein
LVEQAGRTARRRLNYNFHGGADDNPHRFLNAFLEGSNVRPHRHKDPPKLEAFLVLEGRMALFLFDEGGTVERSLVIGSGAHDDRGVDLPLGILAHGCGSHPTRHLLRSETGSLESGYG